MTNLEGEKRHLCKNCGEDNVAQAAEKRAKTAKQKEKNHHRRSKVCLKTNVIDGPPSKDNQVGGQNQRTAGTRRIKFTVKNNFGKVHTAYGVPKGHYLYGRNDTRNVKTSSANNSAVKTEDRTPRPKIVPCDLFVSPRRKETAETPPKEEETGEPLFISSKSIVNPYALHNDDLRYLFKYGVRLPLLSEGHSHSKHEELTQVQFPDDCIAPPTKPPPASVDEHYLIHNHFLSQLPEVSSLYADSSEDFSVSNKLKVPSIVDSDDASTTKGAVTVDQISESILPDGRPKTTHGGTRMSSKDENTVRITQLGDDKPRDASSCSGFSYLNSLSKMSSYNWKGLKNTQKLPQVTNDIWYRATYAASEAKSLFCRTTKPGLPQLPESSLAAESFCGSLNDYKPAQQGLSQGGSEDGSSEPSLCNSGMFLTKQLARRINELEEMKQPTLSHAELEGNNSAKSKVHKRDRKNQKVRGEGILYNQVQKSIDCLQVPTDSQTPINIHGRSLSPSKGTRKKKSKKKQNKLHLNEKGEQSSQTYLDYMHHSLRNEKGQKQKPRTKGSRGRRAGAAHSGAAQAGSAFSTQNGTNDQLAVQSEFACNRPRSRPAECKDQQLEASSFFSENEAVDIEPFLVNGAGVLLENRPPPNTPKPPGEVLEEEISNNGLFFCSNQPQGILRVDIRRTTLVN